MSLLDLVCPTRCSGCGVPGRMVCERCSLSLAGPAISHRPSPCPAGMPPTWVVCGYDGVTRELLLDFKERGVVGLAQPLGEVLARAAGAAIAGRHEGVLMVPIPSAPAAVRRRGDDVVRLLAQRAARRLRTGGNRVKATPALVQRRRVADSAGLSASDRAANLAGALAVSPGAARKLPGATVVLVDDLVTTGATLAEATGALRRVGAHVIGAATVAATRRNRNW